MSAPPDLILFGGDWAPYEDQIYDVFVTTFVRRGPKFNGWPVKAQFRPETHGKGFSFWHVISEAKDPRNRNEEDRIPDLRRCERIAWIAWAIDCAASNMEGFSWWENRRGSNVHVVIWVESYDFAVVLAKRNGFYVLKTAYCELKSHRRQSFERERAEFCGIQKD